MCCGNAGMASLRATRAPFGEMRDVNTSEYRPEPAEQAHQSIAAMDMEIRRLKAELERTQIALAKYVTASQA